MSTTFLSHLFSRKVMVAYNFEGPGGKNQKRGYSIFVCFLFPPKGFCFRVFPDWKIEDFRKHWQEKQGCKIVYLLELVKSFLWQDFSHLECIVLKSLRPLFNFFHEKMGKIGGVWVSMDTNWLKDQNSLRILAGQWCDICGDSTATHFSHFF